MSDEDTSSDFSLSVWLLRRRL